MVNDRLNKFFGRWSFWNEKYTSLRKVMIFVFTLQIERDFNINAGLLVGNVTSPPIVEQRRVYDHLSVTRKSSHGFEIKEKRRVTCLNASPKYKENPKEIKNVGEEKHKWRRKTRCSSEQDRRDKAPKDWLAKSYNTARRKKGIACYKKVETSSNWTIRAEITKGNRM